MPDADQQNEVTTLDTDLDAIAAKVDAALAHVDELDKEIAALQAQQSGIGAPQPLDLSGVVAKAEAIRQHLEGVADATGSSSSGGGDATASAPSGDGSASTGSGDAQAPSGDTSTQAPSGDSSSGDAQQPA